MKKGIENCKMQIANWKFFITTKTQGTRVMIAFPRTLELRPPNPTVSPKKPMLFEILVCNYNRQERESPNRLN